MIGLPKTDKTLLQTVILIVVLYAWISLLGAVFGLFYPIGIFVTWLILCTFLFFKKALIFSKPSREFALYMLIAISFALLIAFYTVPTIFSGRDQGSLSEASMRLSENHSLIQHTPESDAFFDIYGRGKALNFPGFFYIPDGGLLTQFPLPYISFISGFYGLLSVNGFIVANFILLLTFILSITAAARHYMNHRYTLAFLLVLLTSFSIGWFAKFTLSENIAGALLWSVFVLYLCLKKDQNSKTYFTLFLTLSLLLFARIEGIWFFFIFSFLIIRNKSIRSFLKKDLWWRVVFPLTVLFVVALSIAIMNIPFIISIIKATLPSGTESSSTVNSLFDKFNQLFSIYALYGLLAPLSITAITAFLAINHKRYRKILLPLIVILPMMLYYLFPNISSDHPWMLRRFVFALLPSTILISVAFASYIHPSTIFHRISKYGIVIVLLLANIPAFALFITYAENATLTEQIRDLSQNFSDNDLILVDKNAAGNGWSMMTNPLRSLNQKHAVYFFNPLDYDKLNTDAFDKVYLITPIQNKNIYTDVIGDKMRYNKDYTIHTNQLQSVDNEIVFPVKQDRTILGIIYELNKN